LLHQLIFHIHTHTFYSTEHIFGDICSFGPIKTAFSLSLPQLLEKKRIEVNGPIVFELQLVLLHQLIFHIHTHTFYSTEHIFGDICPFGPINTAFSLSSCQLSGKKNRHNDPIGFELQLLLLHQLIFHIHTHTFYKTEPIFGDICPFGLRKTAFSLSS
jgi:hypothetical protein